MKSNFIRSIKLLCCIFFFASGCATSTYMKVPPQWLSKFHLLKPNMTQTEVLQIMGKPSAVQIHQANVPQWPGRSIIWSYNHWQMGGTEPRSYSITMPGQIVGEVITVGGRYVEAAHSVTIGFQDGRVWSAEYSETDATRRTITTYGKKYIDLYTDYGLKGFPSRFPPSGELQVQP